jgi:toxin HigB-1
VIRGFRHKGLRQLFEEDDRSKLDAQDADKIARVLARLSQSRAPQDMAVPGFRLHPLKGKRQGYWAVTVRANWRIVFRFDGKDAVDVDLVDYH